MKVQPKMLILQHDHGPISEHKSLCRLNFSPYFTTTGPILSQFHMIIACVGQQFSIKKYLEITHFSLILKTFCLFLAFFCEIHQNHAH